MIEKQYFLNKNTGKLHICDLCKESKVKPYSIEYFDTEDQALAFAGRRMSWCGTCLKKRDNLLKEAQQ